MGELRYMFQKELEVLECWVDGCGVLFGLGTTFARNARAGGAVFHCPNGHRLRFGEGEIQRLEKEKASLRQRLEWAENRANSAGERAARAERSRNAYKGKLTHVKKRVGNGVCPCCRRSFSNLQRHMATKHPAFAGEES